MFSHEEIMNRRQQFAERRMLASRPVIRLSDPFWTYRDVATEAYLPPRRRSTAA